MAKIIEANTVLTISKLTKNDDESTTIELPADFHDTVLELITQLLGDEYIVEMTPAQ